MRTSGRQPVRWISLTMLQMRRLAPSRSPPIEPVVSIAKTISTAGRVEARCQGAAGEAPVAISGVRWRGAVASADTAAPSPSVRVTLSPVDTTASTPLRTSTVSARPPEATEPSDAETPASPAVTPSASLVTIEAQLDDSLLSTPSNVTRVKMLRESIGRSFTSRPDTTV